MECKRQKLILTSENLLLNPKHREKWGAKVDSITESLHVIEDGLKRVDSGGLEGEVIEVGPFEDKIQDIEKFSLSSTDEVNVNSLQLNVKLFLRTYDIGLAEQAIKYVVESLDTDVIDNLYVTIPAEGFQHIGISARSEDESTPITSEGEDVDNNIQNMKSLNLITLDPEREKYANDLASLWNALSKMPCVDALGLCDVETDVFKKIYQQVEKKPSKVQVNLNSCCVVPPELRQFAATKQIKLSTHADSPDILGDKFCSKVAGFQQDKAWTPLWIVRFQIFKKQHGVLVDKRYMIALDH